MLSKQFMNNYISFLAMVMTVALVGIAYYFLTPYLTTFFGRDYQPMVSIALGVLAVALAYKMMAIIEDDKDRVIEDTEQLANRLIKKIRNGED